MNNPCGGLEKPFTAVRFAKLRNDALQKLRTVVVSEPLTPLWPGRSAGLAESSRARAERPELLFSAKERLWGDSKGWEGRTLKFSRLFQAAAGYRRRRSRRPVFPCRRPHYRHLIRHAAASRHSGNDARNREVGQS